MRAPADVEATPDGGLWIADTGNHRVLFRAPGGPVTELSGFREPTGLCASVSGAVAWVVDAAGLHRVDVDSGDATPIAQLSGAGDVAVDEFAGVAFVSCAGSRALQCVALESGAMTETGPLPADPRGLALAPDRRRLYFTSEDRLGYLDLRDGQPAATAHDVVDGLGAPGRVATTPAGIAVVDPSGNAIRGINPRHGTATVIWNRDLSAPAGVTFDRVNKTLIVADTGNDRVLRVARDVSGIETIEL